jgi:hypothetical protein
LNAPSNVSTGALSTQTAGFKASLTDFEGLSLPEKRQVYQTHTSQQEKLLNFLIGQVMQRTQGRANPQVVRGLIRERLEEPRVR